MPEARDSRNIGLFGAEGQVRIAELSVAIVGAGGLGSHIAQQLAHLGTRKFAVIDDDVVTDSSLNRLIGAAETDVAAGTKKVDVAERTIRSIRQDCDVQRFDTRLASPDARDAIRTADVVFGCLDRDIFRVDLLALASAHGIPYFDTATDVIPHDADLTYGGRMVLSNGAGCLVCLDALDQEQIALDRMNPQQREADKRIYGVDRDKLAQAGPSVVSINGVVASLAVTEFMVWATGLRPPVRQLTYLASQGTLRRSADQGIPDCYYCSTYREASVKRAVPK